MHFQQSINMERNSLSTVREWSVILYACLRIYADASLVSRLTFVCNASAPLMKTLANTLPLVTAGRTRVKQTALRSAARLRCHAGFDILGLTVSRPI